MLIYPTTMLCAIYKQKSEDFLMYVHNPQLKILHIPGWQKERYLFHPRGRQMRFSQKLFMLPQQTQQKKFHQHLINIIIYTSNSNKFNLSLLWVWNSLPQLVWNFNSIFSIRWNKDQNDKPSNNNQYGKGKGLNLTYQRNK